MDGLDALAWALLAVVGMLAYLAVCGRGPRIPGPSWFDLPMPSRSKEQPMPWWTNYGPRKPVSKKARGRAQQTAQHRRRKQRR